jgi:hypothetical protein
MLCWWYLAVCYVDWHCQQRQHCFTWYGVNIYLLTMFYLQSWLVSVYEVLEHPLHAHQVLLPVISVSSIFSYWTLYMVILTREILPMVLYFLCVERMVLLPMHICAYCTFLFFIITHLIMEILLLASKIMAYQYNLSDLEKLECTNTMAYLYATLIPFIFCDF